MYPCYAGNPTPHVYPRILKLPPRAGCAHVADMAAIVDTAQRRGRGKDDVGRTDERIGDDDLTDAVRQHELLDLPHGNRRGGVKSLVEDIALVADTKRA